jgi:transketolase
VAEVLAERQPTPMRRVGLRGYATSGPYYELLDHVGLGEEGVRSAIDDLLS